MALEERGLCQHDMIRGRLGLNFAAEWLLIRLPPAVMLLWVMTTPSLPPSGMAGKTAEQKYRPFSPVFFVPFGPWCNCDIKKHSEIDLKICFVCRWRTMNVFFAQ